MCQQMKRDGTHGDDGTVFICDQCKQFAADLHKMQDDLDAEFQIPGSD